MDSLKVGLKRWLDEVESHYKVKPILYSGDKYFTDFLQREFSDYVLWIANYNFWVEDLKDHWNFWQFSEKGTVRGIKGNVDLNIFNGNIEELERLSIPFKN
ncbi:Glycosyl hydrolases family 25 [compost metagenome]